MPDDGWLSHVDGKRLVDELAAAIQAPRPDAGLIERLCLEVERRMARADLAIGILPPAAPDLMARGFALAGAAGRPGSWLALGRCYVAGHTQELVEFGQRYVPDPADQPILAAAALRCLAEAAAMGDKEAAILFADISRSCSTKAKQTALSFLGGHVAGGTDARALYWYGLVQYALGLKAEAVATQEQAAALGDPSAMFELYVLYATGDGVARDDATAHRWLVRAAELGHDRALYNVAVGHATGEGGFARDPARAVEYYTRAADAGNQRAAATLGAMYLVGDGVTRDPVLAARWLDDAERAGFDVDGWLAELGLSRPAP